MKKALKPTTTKVPKHGFNFKRLKKLLQNKNLSFCKLQKFKKKGIEFLSTLEKLETHELFSS